MPIPSRATVVAITVAVALFLSGCGSSTTEDNGVQDADSSDSTDSPDGDSGSPMTVADAAAAETGTVVTVEGFLIEDSGVLFVSETIAESFPPQPGGVRMEVDGIDVGLIDGVNEEGPIRWLDSPVSISGTVDEGRIIDAKIVT